MFASIFLCHLLYKSTRRFALRAFASLQVTDFVGLTRRSPHRITLRVCGCGSLPAHIRTSVPLSRHFVLIHVCVDISVSLTVLSQLLRCFATFAAVTCIRTSVPLSRHFVLIHVCVDHAYSFLCMLRMPENCMRVDGLIQ